MRVKIIPYYKADTQPDPFWYKSTLNNEVICTCGGSWEDARQRHMEKLSAIHLTPTVPPEEEIEL